MQSLRWLCIVGMVKLVYIAIPSVCNVDSSTYLAHHLPLYKYTIKIYAAWLNAISNAARVNAINA